MPKHKSFLKETKGKKKAASKQVYTTEHPTQNNHDLIDFARHLSPPTIFLLVCIPQNNNKTKIQVLINIKPASS
jgi:hypothetical protein